MTAGDISERLLLAIRSHRRITETILPNECYQGNCEHDECPEVEADLCAACLALVQEVNDELIPDEVLAENCLILRAIEDLDAIGGWTVHAPPSTSEEADHG